MLFSDSTQYEPLNRLRNDYVILKPLRNRFAWFDFGAIKMKIFTYIKVDHDELGEFVREVFRLSLLDLVDLLELFSISDNTDRNIVELDSNDMLIFPHHLSR